MNPIDKIVRDAEERRLSEIDALRLSGLATWDEEREAFCIRRRRAIRAHRANSARKDKA